MSDEELFEEYYDFVSKFYAHGHGAESKVSRYQINAIICDYKEINFFGRERSDTLHFRTKLMQHGILYKNSDESRYFLTERAVRLFDEICRL